MTVDCPECPPEPPPLDWLLAQVAAAPDEAALDALWSAHQDGPHAEHLPAAFRARFAQLDGRAA